VNDYIAQGNNLYVKINSDGHITLSYDGINWPTYTWPQNAPAPFKSRDAHWQYYGIAFAQGHFVAFGNHIVITSTCLPGSEWSSTLTTGGIWQTASFNGSNWVLQDNEGRIATSAGAYPANWSITAATIPIQDLSETDPSTNF
jgi:hypothetical protein